MATEMTEARDRPHADGRLTVAIAETEQGGIIGGSIADLRDLLASYDAMIRRTTRRRDALRRELRERERVTTSARHATGVTEHSYGQ